MLFLREKKKLKGSLLYSYHRSYNENDFVLHMVMSAPHTCVI